MTRRLTIGVLMFVLVAATLPLSAHEEFRIIGTLERVQGSGITVKKNSDNKVIAIKVNAQTEVTQDTKKVDLKALRVGQSVVVDSYGDFEQDSLALEIRIVPPIRRNAR